MTSFKFGWRTVVRTPLKSLLFFFLIALLCLLLAMGSCVFHGVNDYLDQCREYYQSIAELEYLGSEYPDAHYYDEDMKSLIEANADAFESIAALDGVERFQAEDVYLGVIPGTFRKDTKVYDKDAAILTVKIMSWDENHGSYMGPITESLYSREDNLGKLVFLRVEGMELEKDHSYILCGHYISGNSSYLWLEPGAMDVEIDDRTITLPAAAERDGSDEQLKSYLAAAELVAGKNNGYRVQVCASLEDLRPWQQGELKLQDGSLFPQEGRTDNPNVCVIPSRLRTNGGYDVGDTVSISLNKTEAGIYDGMTSSPAPAEDYVVVGVYAESASIYDTIYVRGIPGADVAMTTGYTLGQYFLDNDMAPQFCEQAKELLPENFRLNFYDEGYNAVANPYKELRTMTLLFLLGCVLIALVVAVLFSYLFVYRNRETALTQLALGAGKKNVFRSFIFGTAFVSIPAIIVSLPAAFFLQSRVLTFAGDFAQKHNEGDYRYSSLFSAATKELDFAPEIPVSVFVWSAVFLLLMLLAFVLILANASVAERKPARKTKRTTVPKGHTSTLSGKLKYAVLSVRRGRLRTASVLAMGLAAAVFLATLGASSESYRTQLASIKENTTIRAFATDYMGKQVDGIVMRARFPQTLHETGLFSRTDVSATMGNARLWCVVKTADGTEQEIEEFVEPTGFAAETLKEHLSKEPQWISATTVSGSPLFYYEKEAVISWYDTYDESCMKEPGSGLCVLPTSMMEREGLNLGDTVRFLYCDEGRGGFSFKLFDAVIAGQYVLPWGQEIIYTPLPIEFPVPADDDKASNNRFLDYTTFRSVILTLNDTAQLDEVRQAIEDANISPVRKNGAIRDYMIIDDDEFLNSVQGIERQISYTDAVYTGLYIIAFIIAFVVSYLMVHSRRSEIALMQALGTPGARIWSTFLVEQLILIVPGLALGLGLWIAARGSVPTLAVKLSAVFAVCWLLGASVRLKKAFAENGESLSEPE